MNNNKKFSLVVVDDDYAITTFFNVYIKKFPIENLDIRTFNDPIECLNYVLGCDVRDDCPDIVVIDRQMPSIPGDALNVMLKEYNPNLYTILYTGEDLPTEATRKSYGFDAAFTKCASPSKIINFIRSKVADLNAEIC